MFYSRYIIFKLCPSAPPPPSHTRRLVEKNAYTEKGILNNMSTESFSKPKIFNSISCLRKTIRRETKKGDEDTDT